MDTPLCKNVSGINCGIVYTTVVVRLVGICTSKCTERCEEILQVVGFFWVFCGFCLVGVS